MSELKDRIHRLSHVLNAALTAQDKATAIMSMGPDVDLPDFDWMKWPDNHLYIQQPHLVAQADELTCRRILITLIRGERFNDGMIDEAVARGLLTALAARVHQLASSQTTPT